MCGIAGYADSAGPTVPRESLVRARDALVHRGPDDAGIWLGRDGRIGLATRRLSVIDLSERGHQPLVGHDDRAISFNGEIYNYRELRAELADSWQFRSETDTEAVLAAYARWGDAFIERINGMFAFALADPGRRRLILARDRAGEKPLYYRITGSQLVFASEAKALFQFPNVERRLDPDGLNEYLAFGYQRSDRSAFAGIQKLPPAHIGVYELDSGRFEARPYWGPPLPAASSSGDHLDRLYRAAWGLCGSREDAEDLVQETYAKVLARPRLLRREDDVGYLLRALRNTFLAGRRRQSAAGDDARDAAPDPIRGPPLPGGGPRRARNRARGGGRPRD